MSARSRLQEGLGRPGTTVTSFLEALVGEPVCADDRRHVTVGKPTDWTKSMTSFADGLEVSAGDQLLARSATLRGTRSSQSYVYAETLLAPQRLPDVMLQQLEGGSEPIGRLLAVNGIRFGRSPLPVGQSPESMFGDGSTPEEHLWTRRYRVTVEDAPVMVIAEWFLPSLTPFLHHADHRLGS